MQNLDTQAALRYHEGTKHPGGFLMNPHHRYYPGLEPLPLKVYEGLDPLELPTAVASMGVRAEDAIAGDEPHSSGRQIPDLGVLGRILYFSAGITKKIQYHWGDMYFRAAACTGALYHIELYVVCGDLPGLAAGVFHYEPQLQSLVRLREGDYRGVLVDATGHELSIAQAPAILMLSDVYWRNAVKYQAREYRHTYWDSGTILSHTLAVCAAHHLPARVVMGYADDPANRLLDLDTRREAVIALVSIGVDSEADIPAAPELSPLNLPVKPISERETVFEAILDMHAASSLPSADAAATWRQQGTFLPLPDPMGPTVPLAAGTPSDAAIEEVIVRRGSARRFAREPVSFDQLSVMVRQSTHGVPADFLPQGGSVNHMYLIVHAVDGLAAGTYVYHPQSEALEQLRTGEFREEAGELALGQALAADAAANIYILTDLDAVLRGLGNRGYRAAQMNAGITAGRIYLAAHAQQCSATGLTFFDDAVTEFFSPHTRGKSVMFLIAVGRKTRQH